MQPSESYASDRPQVFGENEDNIRFNEYGIVWISSKAHDIQLHAYFSAHTGPVGHRESSSTENASSRHFW